MAPGGFLVSGTSPVQGHRCWTGEREVKGRGREGGEYDGLIIIIIKSGGTICPMVGPKYHNNPVQANTPGVVGS